ncbi:MAG: chloride channel protein [Flavobacteriales bacterium]|nr:chloride channel protein [Flavobacteriales bacterium]
MSGANFAKQAQLLRSKYLPQKYFVILLAVLVGLLSGLAAVAIKNSVHFIQYLLTFGFVDEYRNYLYFIYPLIGLFLTYVVTKKLLFNTPAGHGIPNTLYAISKKNGIIKRLSIISSVITSALTVGFGGSVGLEGPTVGTSAAIGSNIGRMFKVNYKTKTLLIACAASGALAAIFKAPIAAIVFAIEVIMIDLTMASMIPLLMASVAATITSRLFFGDEIIFHFPVSELYKSSDLGYYGLLGIVCGLFSIYFSKTYFFVSEWFGKFKSKPIRVLIGGSMLGVLLFFLPPLYGEGFQFVNLLIEGKESLVLANTLFAEHSSEFYYMIGFLILVVFFKVLATTITFGAGGVGGIFAPTLFMGSFLGFIFSRTFNFFKIAHLSESNFTLVAMAGLMAGILHAPLTAIFLIAEIAGGYSLFIPLMITASLAYLTVKIIMPHSVYTMQLAKRGELITHHKDKAVLTLMKLQNEIETDFETVSPEMSLGELVKVVSRSKRNLFPVVDEDHTFIGVVQLNDIRQIMFNNELYASTFVHDLMIGVGHHVTVDDNMDTVMNKFEDSGLWNLPVIEEQKYVGFVSKSKLFSAYRKLLQEFYQGEE